jgi:hypothetical protein
VVKTGATTPNAFTLDNPELRAGDFNYRLFQVGTDYFLCSSFVVGPGGPEVPMVLIRRWGP